MVQSTLQTATLSGGVPPAASIESVHVPEHAPFVALAFLGAGAAILIAAGAAALCLAMRRRRAAAVTAGLAIAGGIFYAALLLALSAGSRDRVLATNGRKVFCEMDCHLAYSIAGVDRMRSIGTGPDSVASAAGTFVAARVRTWFDPSTIAPFRGNSALAPNPREAWLTDREGRRYRVSAAATRAYEISRGASAFSPFHRPLSPGESYETALVFDVPARAAGLRLFVGDPPGIENVLLGHENGPFHGKVYFSLD